VRVRAYVTNMNIGDSVFFRAFDVDDPSDDGHIDGVSAPTGAGTKPRHDPDGNDNRGQLSDLHTPAPSRKPYDNNQAFQGRLRAITADDLPEPWGENDAIVEAVVRPCVDKDGNVVLDGQGNPVLVAEVDLLTTFAPGDNFRVAAVPASFYQGLQAASTQTDASIFVPTSGLARLTPQLSVWRYLHVENDVSIDVYGLMGGGVNRQTNRFADAYLEPEYNELAAHDTSDPPSDGPFQMLANGQPHPAVEAAIDQHRQSKNYESPLFWVVYLTDSYRSPAPNAVFGYTYNRFAAAKYEVSLVFTQDIAQFFPPQDAPTACEKTAVHEVGHQLLALGGPFADREGHRGKFTNPQTGAGSLGLYYRAPVAGKRSQHWEAIVNIMSPDAIQVPMNSDAQLYGGSGGPIDRYYFHPLDVAEMRENHRVDNNRA